MSKHWPGVHPQVSKSSKRAGMKEIITAINVRLPLWEPNGREARCAVYRVHFSGI